MCSDINCLNILHLVFFAHPFFIPHMRIEEAIKQKTFKSPQHRAQVNIIYTAAWLNQFSSQALKPYGISIQQFNILRILRGRRGEPATIKLLTSRMLDKMSNASRLVDKLVAKKMVERCQSDVDRRQVDITITDHGLRLLDQASAALETATMVHLNNLDDQESSALSDLLDQLRGAE